MEQELKALPSRGQIDEEFKWNLTDIYKSNKEWEVEFNKVKKMISKIESYQGNLGKSATSLLKGLKLNSKISRLLEKLYNYAARKKDEDTTNNKNQAMFAKVQNLHNEITSATSFIVPEIIQIPVPKLKSFLRQNENLKLYQQYLDNIIRQKEHYLSAKEEEIIALAGQIAQGPENIFGMINNADIEFPTIKDDQGKEVEITHGRYIDLLKKDNRQMRKKVFKAYYSSYQKLENTIAQTLSTNIKKDVFYVKARDYSNSLEAALDDNNIPVEVYNNLLVTVENNLSTMYDYINLRQEALGLKELHMYDLYVPLVEDVEMKISYQEAQDIILQALEPLGAEYLEVVKQAFEERWIDVYESKGKRSGAYSSSCYDAHPYILLNYNDNIDNLFTLAHELGHALHSYYSNQQQPYIYSNYSIFVAEVASTVNEALLMQYLLKTTKEENKRKYLLNHYLEQFRGTVYRQTMFAEFEKEIHDLVESGEALTPDLLAESYHQLNRKYYGDKVIIDQEIDIEWARIPHFYYNFYVYQYATGFSAAISLSQKILKGDQDLINNYLDFLKGGSSDYPINLLEQTGVDMRTPEPIDKALNVFSDLVAEMKKLF